MVTPQVGMLALYRAASPVRESGGEENHLKRKKGQGHHRLSHLALTSNNAPQIRSPDQMAPFPYDLARESCAAAMAAGFIPVRFDLDAVKRFAGSLDLAAVKELGQALLSTRT